MENLKNFPYDNFYNFRDNWRAEDEEWDSFPFFYRGLSDAMYALACEEARRLGIDRRKDPEAFQNFLDTFSFGVDEFDRRFDHLTDELSGIRCRSLNGLPRMTRGTRAAFSFCCWRLFSIQTPSLRRAFVLSFFFI